MWKFLVFILSMGSYEICALSLNNLQNNIQNRDNINNNLLSNLLNGQHTRSQVIASQSQEPQFSKNLLLSQSYKRYLRSIQTTEPPPPPPPSSSTFEATTQSYAQTTTTYEQATVISNPNSCTGICKKLDSYGICRTYNCWS